MIQVATFLVPKQEAECNEFLRTHKSTTVNFNKDMVVVFWDDFTYPVQHEIADLRELIVANIKGRHQFEVTQAMMEVELEHAKEKGEKEKVRQIEGELEEIKETLASHDQKRAFTEGKIKKLEVQLEPVKVGAIGKKSTKKRR